MRQFLMQPVVMFRPFKGVHCGDWSRESAVPNFMCFHTENKSTQQADLQLSAPRSSHLDTTEIVAEAASNRTGYTDILSCHWAPLDSSKSGQKHILVFFLFCLTASAVSC